MNTEGVKRIEKRVTRGEWYQLTATEEAIVFANLNGVDVILDEQTGGCQHQNPFQAPADTITICTNGEYVLLPAGCSLFNS